MERTRVKKMMALMLAWALMLAGLPLYSMEVRAEVSGDYEYSVDGDSVTITRYIGSGGEVTIPSEIEGKAVTNIGSGAFVGCSSLTSISIPGSVTSIGVCAFESCSSLENISVAEGNEVYDSRSNCNAVIETESNTLIIGCKNTNIPEGVTSIGDSAFWRCSSLTSISIPGSVTSIGYGAFGYCSSLTSISIPGSVTSIESGAFENCSSLTSISIPGSVTSIGDNAFYGCNPDLLIYGEAGSEAEHYARYYEIKFQIISGGSTEQPAETDIAQASITLGQTSYTYDGKAKEPSVTVKLNGKTLDANTDYTVSYSNNTNVGTATVTITGKGVYTGTKSVNFKIVDVIITCKKTVYKVTYGAKPFRIDAASGSRLSFISSDAKVASVGRNTGKVTIRGVGVAVITVSAGNTSVKVTVKVSPGKQSLKSVKALKDRNASGYQVQVSTSGNFKKGMKQKNVTKTSYTFTKLKAGKKYYVRVRSYKKAGKEKLYGAWSGQKQSGKVKK